MMRSMYHLRKKSNVLYLQRLSEIQLIFLRKNIGSVISTNIFKNAESKFYENFSNFNLQKHITY